MALEYRNPVGKYATPCQRQVRNLSHAKLYAVFVFHEILPLFLHEICQVAIDPRDFRKYDTPCQRQVRNLSHAKLYAVFIFHEILP
jgi:hypothetical protein